MKLTVILADTHRTYMAIAYEGDHVPYRRRTVQIELTPEQTAAIAPQLVGENAGKKVYEELMQCWIEPAAAKEE